ncbi:hypothetical protein [Sorangium atrum]|uniref:Uncharacterized protein n=1 Tax=Sorangium atrum TaxID=2995308 RepID=A0ABT5C2A7_9BACT|nr:hypothetical protein [Sorangium aterium]MDC0680529.1 hypothetical protein [Sorangium aterium]
MDKPDVIANGQEAFQHLDSITDRFTRILVHQGLIDLLSSYCLLPGDSPLHLDMLTYTHCLEAIYADRARVAMIASGSSGSIDPSELRARVAAAAAAGAIKRASEALAHCEALPDGPVRELERFGLATSTQVIAAREPGVPPVDFLVHARLLEASFQKTYFVQHVAEGKDPSPFI